ncbi:MAG: roadblock/LC7 domain-containing protein [Pseudomonadota bacterium]
MAVELTLAGELYAQATPAGAFYAVASPQPDNSRQTLLSILRHGEHSPLSDGQVLEWTGADSVEDGLKVLFRLQRLGLVRGVETPVPAPQERLEDVLPALIGRLSDKGKAVLADDNGFYLAASGYPHEAAEELAGLAGDLLALHARHGRLLKNNLKLATEAWALVDPAGRSELGFWPLYIGKQNFVLIIGETPRLQNQEFVTLIQALNNRYA